MKCLDGDVNQMYAQKDFLESKGFYVSTSQGIPMINTLEYGKALELILKYKIPGWWVYKEDLIMYGICDSSSYESELNKN